MTTAAAQIATGQVGFAALVEMQFSGGTIRVSTLPQNIDWNGYTWTGLGVLGDIEAVTATSNTDARPIALTLTVANATYFSLANGNIDTYRGRPCRIYYAVMDTSCTQILPDPRLVWFGVMDVVANKIGEDGKGAVTLKCEPHSISINRKNTKRVSHQQQLKEYPGDMFYEFLEDLIAKPTLWLSKKFQGI